MAKSRSDSLLTTNIGAPDPAPLNLKTSTKMEMAKYIISILRSQAGIVMSWGFHNAVALRNGLGFRVQGFLFTGIVRVLYDEGSDTFSVRLEKRDGSLYKERQEVYFDELVDVIDRLVERCPDYEKRVRAEYGLSNG